MTGTMNTCVDRKEPEYVMRGAADRERDLREHLKKEMEMHIMEGRVSLQRNQERVGRIRELKEQLQNELSDQSQHSSEVEYEKLLEQMKRQRETHEGVIEEELMKMEKELQDEQVSGVDGELKYLQRERHVLVLQMEALRRERQQLYAALEQQQRCHDQEVKILRDESLQVFRTFRQVLEEQRRASEGRYRALLLDAIQDAVHLSAQNLQLQEEVQQLQKAEKKLVKTEIDSAASSSCHPIGHETQTENN